MCPLGVQFYTVGPGQNLNVPMRPDRLEAAYFRQNGNTVNNQGDYSSDFNDDYTIGPSPVIQFPQAIDYPLELVQSQEEYSRIAMKSLSSFPSFIFYDNAWPVGAVYPWPVIQADLYELHLVLKMVLKQFKNLTTAISLPPEYYAAIHANLVVRLCFTYKQPVDPEMKMQAKQGLNIIRGANTQIGQMKLPTDLIRPGVYNPYSDQVR